MAKKSNQAPSRTCADCFHYLACLMWCSSVSDSVAPKCPQFEPARYASIADLHKILQMAKGELVPVVHASWKQRYEDWRHQIAGNECSACGFVLYGPVGSYCPRCGAKMDGGVSDATD